MVLFFIHAIKILAKRSPDTGKLVMDLNLEEDPHKVTAALLARVSESDPKALDTLYDRCAGCLLGVIHSILPNQEEAEDTLQEVFVIIWKKAGTYDPKLGKAISWLITIARNRAFDRARSLGRKAQARREREEDLSLNLREQLQKQWHPTLPKDEHNSLTSALNSLPEEQQKAIRLAYLEGLTQQEIAEHLEEPLGTIKARIRRGLLKLRKHLQTNKLGKSTTD